MTSWLNITRWLNSWLNITRWLNSWLNVTRWLNSWLNVTRWLNSWLNSWLNISRWLNICGWSMDWDRLLDRWSSIVNRGWLNVIISYMNRSLINWLFWVVFTLLNRWSITVIIVDLWLDIISTWDKTVVNRLINYLIIRQLLMVSKRCCVI